MDGDRARMTLADTSFAHLDWVVETESTNRDLLDLSTTSGWDRLPRVLVTDHQSAGRGRRDRTWVDEPGCALLVSVLLEPMVPPSHLSLLTLAFGVSAIDAAASVCGVSLGLKWPNDLVTVGSASTADRKVAGILAETKVRGPDIDAVVIGMGMNANTPTADTAEPMPSAATVSELAGRPIDREDLLIALLTGLSRRLEVLATDLTPLLDEVRSVSATLGRSVRVDRSHADGVVSTFGQAIDLRDDGALIVRADGVDQVVTAADVVHLRPTD